KQGRDFCFDAFSSGEPVFASLENATDQAPAGPGMELCVTGRVQPRQLAFALPHAESLTRDNFLEGPANAAGVAPVDPWPEWPNRIMLLVGPEGSGKSHLAAIWAEQAGARAPAAHALAPASV